MSHRHPIESKDRALELYTDLRSEPIPEALAATLQLVTDASDVLWHTSPNTPAETRAFLDAAASAERLGGLASAALDIARNLNLPPLLGLDPEYDQIPWTPHLSTIIEASMCFGVAAKLYTSVNDRIRLGHDFWSDGDTENMVEAASIAMQPFVYNDPNFSDPANLYLQQLL